MLTFFIQDFAALEGYEELNHPRAVPGIRNHGTAVAGMAVGSTLGVAKRATLVFVTLAPDSIAEDIKYMWRVVINDVTTKHRTGKAVIVYPFGMLPTPQGIW